MCIITQYYQYYSDSIWTPLSFTCRLPRYCILSGKLSENVDLGYFRKLESTISPISKYILLNIFISIGTELKRLIKKKRLFLLNYMCVRGDDSGKEPTCQCRRCKRQLFDPWVRKIPWRR